MIKLSLIFAHYFSILKFSFLKAARIPRKSQPKIFKQLKPKLENYKTDLFNYFNYRNLYEITRKFILSKSLRKSKLKIFKQLNPKLENYEINPFNSLNFRNL